MKWLLFAIIMAGLIIWWRTAHIEQNNRSTAKPNPKPKTHTTPKLMSQCPFCGLRFPSDEGVGNYCSIAHKKAIDAKGWWGEAEWVPSPNYDERPSHMPVELVLVHHISLPPGQFTGNYIADFFQNKLNPKEHPYFESIADRQVSSHFLIRRNGQVQQFVSANHRAWHAGVSDFFGRERCNDFSIGIELEGTDDLPFQPAQYTSLRELVFALKKVYPVVAFAGHSDVAPGRKTDPGIHFDWQLFAKLADISEKEMPYGTQKR